MEETCRELWPTSVGFPPRDVDASAITFIGHAGGGRGSAGLRWIPNPTPVNQPGSKHCFPHHIHCSPALSRMSKPEYGATAPPKAEGDPFAAAFTAFVHDSPRTTHADKRRLFVLAATDKLHCQRQGFCCTFSRLLKGSTVFPYRVSVWHRSKSSRALRSRVYPNRP